MSIADDDASGEPKGRRTADRQSIAPTDLAGIGAGLASIQAQVAALQGELYRSLNGVEKVTEKGFEHLGQRMDKLEAWAGSSREWQAKADGRLEALEERARADDRRAEETRRIGEAERRVLQEDKQRFTVWQILLGAAIGTLGFVGTIFGIVGAAS